MQIEQTQLEQLMPLLKEALSDGRSVHLSPSGVSMLPMLREGIDSVVLSPLTRALKKFDLPLYRRDNGQYVLHRITAVGHTYTCMGDNQFAKETGLRDDQFIGIVTSFYRNGRSIKVTNLTYRIYCFFWHYTRIFRRIWRKVTSYFT